MTWLLAAEGSAEWAGVIANFLSFFAACVGIYLVVRGFRHNISANFISAYKNIIDIFAEPEATRGRHLCRVLHKIGGGKLVRKGRVKMLEQEDPAFSDVYLKEIREKYGSEEAIDNVIRRTFSAMDLVAILAMHSGIRGLDKVVAREWRDSIIAVWTQGQWVIESRVIQGRMERAESFAALVALSKSLPEDEWYPFKKDSPVARLARDELKKVTTGEVF